MIRRLFIFIAVLGVLIVSVPGVAMGSSTWPGRSTAISSTRGWFAAINAHNRRRLLFYVASSADDQMGWARAGRKWSEFTRLHCRALPASNRHRAIVYCSFDESTSPNEGNPDSFWDVFLHYTRTGWLITGYGQ